MVGSDSCCQAFCFSLSLFLQDVVGLKGRITGKVCTGLFHSWLRCNLGVVASPLWTSVPY